jgi:Family of unknown function (DUF5678)
MSTPTLNEIKQQVLLLTDEDRKALAEFLVAHTEDAAENGKRRDPPDFSREMEWIRQNRESYRGQFVALNEGQLVAAGAKEREVWEAAKHVGVSVPFLAYIETTAEEAFGGW